jgi:hypothetical protein
MVPTGFKGRAGAKDSPINFLDFATSKVSRPNSDIENAKYFCYPCWLKHSSIGRARVPYQGKYRQYGIKILPSPSPEYLTWH